MASRPPAARRRRRRGARHRAGRRRWAVVRRARRGSATMRRRASTAHRLARIGAGGSGRAPVPRSPCPALARPRRASRPLPGQGRRADQYRRDRARHWEKPGWSEAGSREEILARFSPAAWAEPARALLAAPEHGTNGRSTTARPAALGRRAGHAARRCGPSGAAVPGAGRRAGDRRRRRAGRMPGRHPDDPASAHAPLRRMAAPAHHARRSGPRATTARVYHMLGPDAAVRNLVAADGRRKAALALRLALWLAGRYDRCADRMRRPHVPHHHRRQPAQARLARRAEQALGAVAAVRARSSPPPSATPRCSRSKLQEDAGIDIVSDGEQSRQHFVHGFLEFVDGIDFAQQGRDGHPQQSLQGDGADRHRRAAAEGPRACDGGAARARPHERASSNSPCPGR